MMKTIKFNEKIRKFEILEREELEKRIEELETKDIYKMTEDKAGGYTFGGTATTYIEARSGEVYTDWMQQNNSKHPFDDFSEIVLCSVNTPNEGYTSEDLIDDEKDTDWDEWQEENGGNFEEYIIEKYGKKELEERQENVLNWYAGEFVPDWEFIEKQLNELYEEI